MNKQDAKNLKKRYLIWLYKTTKEALDKIDRKFTQLGIDRSLLEELKARGSKKGLRSFISEFENYIVMKEKDGLNLKYKGLRLKPEYEFLSLKLQAIEKVIKKMLGKRELAKIKAVYEQEMVRRIMEERDAHR